MNARAAVRRLRVGVVPRWQLRSLTIGYEVVERATEALLKTVQKAPEASVLFVKGEWGTGKTHALSVIKEVAQSLNMTCATVTLNPRTAALSHPQRFIGELCATFESTDAGPGVRDLLLSHLADPGQRQKIKAYGHENSSDDIGNALLELCRIFEIDGHAQTIGHPAWELVEGSDLSWADYSYKKREAVNRIGQLAGVTRALGYDGLLLLFDETETIDQLWNIRSRMSAYWTIGRLASLPHTACCFAITERFDRTIHWDLVRGADEYDWATEEARWFLATWEQNEFTVVSPPLLDTKGASELARRTIAIYEDAYGQRHSPSPNPAQLAAAWSKDVARNPRWLLRRVVYTLDIARELIPIAEPVTATSPLSLPDAVVSTVTKTDSHATKVFDVAAYLVGCGLTIRDNRANRGALWVIGDLRLADTLGPLARRGVRFTYRPDGGRATSYKPGWWTNFGRKR